MSSEVADAYHCETDHDCHLIIHGLNGQGRRHMDGPCTQMITVTFITVGSTYVTIMYEPITTIVADSPC